MAEKEFSQEFAALFEKEWKPIERKIKSELQPFLDSVRAMGGKSRNFKIFKQAFFHFQNKHERVERIFKTILEARTKFSSSILEDTIYLLYVYLGAIESLGNSIVDILVILLVANGRDFHIERAHDFPRIIHAVSIRELEKERVSLTTKLNFLKYNGVSELSSIIDSKLRNDIAHLKFDIKENEIYVRGQPAFVISFLSLLKLNRAIETTEELLRRLAEEKGLTKRTQ